MMIRILIVGGSRLYRDGLAQLLGGQLGFAVVGVRSERQLAAGDIQKLKPNVVLLDISSGESLAIVHDINQLAPDVAVVALGVAGLERDVLSCVEAGVAGYVTREESLADLTAVVESAARGDLRCSPMIAGSLLRRVAAAAAHREPSPSQGLTTREREILRLIGQGLSNKQIAARLGIEVATVKNHVHNLLGKLNVHRRSEAVRLFSQFCALTGSIGLALRGCKQFDLLALLQEAFPAVSG
jgi:DNA-binding NarL/FixJ family response regulator